jgi:hypothetical protein
MSGQQPFDLTSQFSVALADRIEKLGALAKRRLFQGNEEDFVDRECWIFHGIALGDVCPPLGGAGRTFSNRGERDCASTDAA